MAALAVSYAFGQLTWKVASLFVSGGAYRRRVLAVCRVPITTGVKEGENSENWRACSTGGVHPCSHLCSRHSCFPPTSTALQFPSGEVKGTKLSSESLASLAFSLLQVA